MWTLIGTATANAETEQVTVGPIDTFTDDGRVWLRISTDGGESMRPLAFGIVGFKSTGGSNDLGTARYYPERGPTLVQLGPSPFKRVVGEITFRPRSYNLRWLSVGLPFAVWRFTVEAFVVGAATGQTVKPPGFVFNGIKLLLGRSPVGIANAHPLSYGN
jgi:hypothetical protein